MLRSYVLHQQNNILHTETVITVLNRTIGDIGQPNRCVIIIHNLDNKILNINFITLFAE